MMLIAVLAAAVAATAAAIIAATAFGGSGDRPRPELARQLQERGRADARAAAAARVRNAEQATSDPALDREGLRVMEIAIGRYQNHFLTERNVSNLRVGSQIVELLTADGGALHAA